MSFCASLSLWGTLPERHGDFVVHRPLRPRRPEFPLQPVLAVVELRHLRNHALQVHAHQLPRRLAQLEHHADRRLLPRRLVQSLRVGIVLADTVRRSPSPSARPAQSPCGQARSELLRPRVQSILQHHRGRRDREELRRRSSPAMPAPDCPAQSCSRIRSTPAPPESSAVVPRPPDPPKLALSTTSCACPAEAKLVIVAVHVDLHLVHRPLRTAVAAPPSPGSSSRRCSTLGSSVAGA